VYREDELPEPDAGADVGGGVIEEVPIGVLLLLPGSNRESVWIVRPGLAVFGFK
jgi:hypothetical protein